MRRVHDAFPGVFNRSSPLAFWLLWFISLTSGCSRRHEETVLSTSATIARRVAFSANDRILATVHAKNPTLTIWKVDTGSLLWSIAIADIDVLALAFAPDGRTVASAWDGITFWEVDSGRMLKKIQVPGKIIGAIAFSPDGKWIASGERGGSVKIWDAQSGSPIRSLEGSKGAAPALAFSPKDELLAYLGDDSKVIVADPNSGKTVRTLTSRVGPVSQIVFVSEGHVLVLGGPSGTVEFLNTTTWETVRTLKLGEYRSMAVSPSGAKLAYVPSDKND